MKASISIKLSFTALLFLSTVFFGCSSSAPSSAAQRDLPEICRHYDFNKDPAMAEECGIRQTRYKSYKNIPSMRYLITPKDAQLVLDRKDGDVELRLDNTIPVKLGKELARKVDFSDQAKPHHLKNQYIYKELYPTPSNRIKIFKLRIPISGENWLDYCFQIPNRPKGNEKARSYTVHTLEPISCSDFDHFVKTFQE